MHIIEYDKWEYLGQHIILSMTSICIGSLVKNLKTDKEMWEKVKNNTTTKSMLYLIDTEDQLNSMRLADSDDPRTHLNDLKQHFELMTKSHDNLMQMGSSISNMCLSSIIMLSLPPSYQSAIQTITAAEKIGVTQGMAVSPKMTPNNLISFFTEEAQHHLIDDECAE